MLVYKKHYFVCRHQKELSSLKMKQRQEIHMYLMQQHSQRHRVSRGAQDLSGATPDSGLTGTTANIAVMQKDSGVPVPLTTPVSTFDIIPAPWMMQIAPSQHMIIPAVSMQHAVQSFPVMFPDTEQAVYNTATSQELPPVAVAIPTSDTMSRQPTTGKPAEAQAVPVLDDTVVACQQIPPEYLVEAHVYPDHVTSEKVFERNHVRKESDGGLHTQEVNRGASVQVPRLQSASLTPHGSPVMQHKQTNVTPVTSTSLTGFTPSVMLQPKVLPAYAPMPSLTPHGHYIMAQHQMSTFTPQQLQILQQQQLQQYGLQNTTPSAVSQIQLPPQQQRAGFVMQESQQKQPSQFLQQPSLRSQLLDANSLATYMVSQQYQQMALSNAVPPSWLYLPSVTTMPAGQPQFTPGVAPASQPAGFISNPVLPTRPVMTQSAPLIPVSQPTTTVPVATVPPVTSGT